MTGYADRIDRDVTGAVLVEVAGAAGVRIMRYGLVFLLLMWGAAKFTAFEAETIVPLVDHSPLLAWLHVALGTRLTSAVFGVFEMSAGLLIGTRKWLPRVSGYASLAAASMFVITLSFLVTTPGVLEATNFWGSFLMKDIEFLGAALFTFAEALQHRRGSVA